MIQNVIVNEENEKMVKYNSFLCDAGRMANEFIFSKNKFFRAILLTHY